jgi:ABC-2 type transport system permease protein
MIFRLGRIASIYGKLLLLHLRTHLEYKADFLIGIVGVLLTQMTGIIFISVLFSRIPDVKGWTLWEIALLYALAIIAGGLTQICGQGQWRLHFMINQGDFDQMLVRPISPALQVLTQFSSLDGLGSILLGGIILWRASLETHIVWNLEHILLLLTTLFGAVPLMLSIQFAFNCVAFWEQGANSSFPFLIVSLSEFAKFPLTLYDRSIQILLTWILPFAFISYYPGLVLLGKPEVEPWVGYLTPVTGFIVMLITGVIWKHALLRYQSVGH